MNKIFRIVWSYATQSWVVVSELTKAHKKQSSSNSLKAALGAATVLLSINSAEAAVLIGSADGTTIQPHGSTVSDWGITIGGAVTKTGGQSVHIGDATGSVGTRNVVIGTYASAGYDDKNSANNPPKDGAFNQSVAIGAGKAPGEGARAYGDQSIAIGSNTIARGNSSIAIGNDDVDKTETIDTTYTDLEGNRTTATIGTAYNKLTGKNLKWDGGQYADTTAGEAAVAIGVKAEAGDISLALGTAAKAKVVNGVAIGSGATATRDNAVAIGGGSTTEVAATKELNTTVNGLTFNWAGGERTIAGDVVSFGKDQYERQLKHVSPGAVTATSTDAINGSQLYGVLNHLTSDPVYFYGADDSSDDKVAGGDAKKKSADAKDKRIVARSMADSRLNLKGGATGELTDNNIGVKYEDEGTIRFKLAKALTGLTSAEFKDANNNVVNITPTGVSFKKPDATDTNTVTLSQNGLNNGGNAITNVAGNLEGAKLNSTAPTTSATAPNNVDGIKNNAATVGDVLQAGWNLQNNGTAKDFVKPYDTVNFADGNGTTAVVETTENKTSTVKYNVNLGNGLEKNSANEITIKPADKSLEVTTAGLKAKTDGTTITTDPTNGLKVVTGGIEAGTKPGTVKVTDGDNDKIATVDSVVNAVNSAAFTLKASAIEGGTRNTGSTVTATGESIKAGSTIEMIAGKNLDVTHNKNGKITFATVDNPSFSTVQVGDNEGPKFSATADGNIKVSDKDDANPVKITNVKDGEISKTSKDAINGSQFHKLANNTIKLAGQNGDDASGETEPQNLNQKDGIKFTVKSSDGKLLEVTAGGDTITLTPKTATLTTTDGVPTADTTNGKLVTADQLVTALTEMGWKATAGKDGTGTVDGNTEELIKAGETVTFKAGNNLAVKQAGKDFIYSLKTELTGLTSAEFKNAAGDKTVINGDGVTITPVAEGKKPVSLTKDGLNNGGNPITNVISGLTNYTEADKHGLRNLTNANVLDTTAATVGDLRNMGWVVSSNKTTGALGNPYSEAVKNANEVKFVGTGLATVSGKTENGVRTITVDVESKTAINAVTYTKPDGTKVYPVEGPTGTTYHTTPEGKGPNDETVDGSNVITSVNGPKGTQIPSTLSNVAGNLDGAKAGTDAPTTKHDAPNTTEATGPNYVNPNNAATVGDVLQAGWNLQNNGTEKDFVKPYDTVNFVDGNGTTAVVDTTENKTSTVKYNVNLGNGLDKTTDNKITVKPADSSLVVDAAGVKVNTGTVNTVETGDKKGTVEVPTTDAGKIATVDTVIKAVNSASFTLKASATTDGTRNGNSTVNANGESIKAGSTIEMIAGKNLDVKHDKNGKITFATVDNPSFSTVQVGDNEGPKFSATADGNIKVSDKDDANPVKITNVKDGEISKTSKDAINGSQFHKLANNTIKLAGQNGDDASGETEPQNLNQKDGIKFTVKSSDGKLLEVTAGGDTITITPKTGTITTTNGVPTATTTNGKLVTADEVVKALTEMGWKATADQEGTGTVEGKAEELIKAGHTVTFKAGDNLAIKQDGKNFIYSLNPALTGLTSAEFKDGDNKVKITPTGITITKPAGTTENTVTLNQNGLNNGGNPITNVAGNLQGAKAGTDAPITSATAPTLGTGADEVNKNNAATVGDVLNAGWNLQEKGAPKDFVKPYDTVNFIDGDGTSVAVATANDGTTSTVKYSVNLGNGLEKTTDNKITVKPADKSLEVTDDGLKVKTDTKTITTGDNGLTVNTGTVNAVTQGDKKGTVEVPTADAGKIATVDTVAKAVNNASFTLKASAIEGGTRNTNSTVAETGESIKAGNTIEMIAGKNLNVTHNTNGKITFATVENPSFNTVQIGNSEGPKFSATADGNIKVSNKDDTKPVKITNVADGTISDTSKDAINGSQIHKLVNKAIKLAGQNGSDASGETDPQNLTQQDPIKFTVKSSDGTLLHVTAAGDTITITPKTGTITTGEDGIPTANTTGGKLVTADNLVKALTEMGWKATAGQEGTGTVEDSAEELIKAGSKVTFKAGNNLAVKQAGKDFIYSLKTELTGLTSAEFKNAAGDITSISPTGVTITPVAADKKPVTLTTTGLNNGGNPITNVTSGLANHTEVGKHELRNLTNTAVPDTTAATVGDLRNMGWVVSSNKTTGALGNPYSEAVKNANEVKFVGTGLATVSGKTENGVRTITVDVESKTAINAVTYTKPDGTKVYPVEGPTGTTYHTTPEGKGPNDETVDGSDVITSVNGPKGTKTPSTLSNVAGNLEGAKANSTAPTTNATAPNNVDGIKNNAATVGDVLQAGWNLQNNGAEKDFVKPYDTVNFADGNGTTAVVDTTENKTSTVKYNVNLGNGLDKTTDNKITVKPADSSLVVDAAGVKVNTGTVNTVETGDKKGTVEVPTADAGKIATVDTVAKAVNSAAFILKASATTDGTRNTGSTVDANGESIKAGNTVELVAGKNLDVKHEANGKITFATKDNVTFETVQVGDAQGPKLSKTDAGDLKVSGPNGTDPVKVTNVKSGLDKYGDQVNNADVPGTTDKNRGLVDLSKPANGDPKVSDNTAATVGDLRNMGWIVSADKKTDDLTKEYSDTVKNANEVKFVGEGTAIVSGKTEGNVRTITVKVDDQVSTNNSVTPVNYTKKDGTKVYPKMVKNPDTGKEELKFFENPNGTGNEVPKGDVVTSINGPEGTTSPTTLKNVKNNIPTVNDEDKKAHNVDGTEISGKNNTEAPITAKDAADLLKPTVNGVANPKYIGNNAATVSDVLNAGWNLQNNGAAKDFVKPYDTLNFINGLGTTAVVTTREGSTTSDVTFNVKAANGSVTVDEDGVKVTTGEMKPTVDANNKETGAIATPVDPTRAKQLKDTLDAAVKELATAKDALKAAETELAAKPNDPALKQAVEDKKAQVAAKQTPVNDAQKAHDDAGLNKVATVQNVAEAINNAGFNLKTSADGGEKLTTGSKNDGELIKPGNTVEMVAGNNLTVKQDEHGKITYATKDDVTFKTVDTGTLTVGNPNTYTDGKGNTYTKVGENYYKPADVVNGTPKPDATPVDVTTTPVTQVSPVTMKTEAAKPAKNNATDEQPSSALNVTSKDGKPTQITGVGSTLNTNVVKTTPEGTTAKPGTTPKTEDVHLVDLKGTDAAPVNKNAAATVGDLQNMGWVVSAKDGNGYKDVVKNANVVDFKGDQGVTVTGKTLSDGTREITVGIKEGEVTNKVTITHADGTKTDAVKIGDNYYKVDENGKPVGYEKGNDGKPAGTPLTINPTEDKVTNNGAGVVTGNAVANAIQDSGWNVGIGSTDKDFSKDAKVYDKVNPNDDVKFANGANTNVSMVTVDALNEDGTKKATTFVKVDINRDLKIDSVTTGGTATDKNGNNLVKVGDQYYKEGDVTVVTNPDGTKTVTAKENAKAVPPADVIPAKDGAMIVKNADGKDVVSATVGKDGNGAFGINGKDGKNGISMTAKDGQGTIGVNGKDGKSTTIAGDTITIKDKDNNATNIGVNTITLVDKAGNTTTTTADKSEIKDAAGNMNTSTPTTNVLKDTNGNTNASTATGTTYTDKDKNTTTVGPKEIALSDKDGNNTSKLTNNDLLLNTKDPNTGVEKTSHMSGDKISFNTTDEIEKGPDGKPVIDPKTNNPKVKNPGNSTEYTNEGLKVIPNSTVARDVNGNPTFLDKDGKPVMKDKDGSYKYMGQDGKPGANYTGAVGSLKSNVVDNTRVISFGMDKPVLDSNGKPVMAPDGKPVMTEGISAGMQRVHNVAPGRISPTSTDAVNGSQLYAVASNIGNLNNKINKVGKRADAGTASALAAATIPQAYTPGKSLVGIAAGSYQGQNGLAVGMSRISDNGKIIIRLSGTANTQGKTGVAAGVGYQW